MKGVILHGGRGTRLRPLTHTGPKQLIPIANKPISQYVVEDLRNAGITEIALVLGDIFPEKVMEYYGDGGRFGVQISYIEQGTPRGIAHAVALAEGFVSNEPFAVYLGDNILRSGITKLVNNFKDSSASAQIALAHVKNPEAFGVAEIKNGRIVRLVEKPKSPPSDLALVGVYFFHSEIFDAIRRLKPSWRGELEITEAIQVLIDQKRPVEAEIVDGWWKDTGRPEDILEANQLVLSDIKNNIAGEVQNGVTVTGNVELGEGTTVISGSHIRGPAIIGKNCKIGPDAYIGPYSSIGDNVTIRGAEIENSIVIGDSVIECPQRIVDSIIGRNATIVASDLARPKGCKLIIGENTVISI